MMLGVFRETEIQVGDGAIRNGGKVKLQLGSFDNEQQALVLYDQLRTDGYGAKIRPILHQALSPFAHVAAPAGQCGQMQLTVSRHVRRVHQGPKDRQVERHQTV